MKYIMYAKNFRSRRKADLAFIGAVERRIAEQSQTTQQQEVLHGTIKTKQIV
jgi:hypothetical protein